MIVSPSLLKYRPRLRACLSVPALLASLLAASLAFAPQPARAAAEKKPGATRHKAERHPKALKVLAAGRAARGAGGKAAKAAAAAAALAAARKLEVQGEPVNFRGWQAVADFEADMVSKYSFDAAALKAVMEQVNYIDAAVQLVKPAPPGKPKNWQAYRDRFIEPVRINAGIEFWNRYADVLARAEAQYGVPAEIIVGIIGVETVYGRNTGRFRALDVLTTLAFAYPDAPNRLARQAFFRGELENTLLLARKSNIDPFSLIGSFAGAIGLPQFMPGSILAYGVDFDADGKIDLRGSPVDAIGSVANFLVQHGWRPAPGQSAVYPAQVSASRAWEGMIGQGLKATYTPEQLSGAGVTVAAALPADTLFGLVDLQNGAEATEYWLASDNFFAITQYNRSYFYAMSVIDLGRTIRQARAGGAL
ncbi:lytic murein transglycosylase B [Massilia sp. DWR3-1-1]|uniref:lytic murein transglycosylase B n=1 Tax=Massilia sp. DWR3-1-1 TaxID=2804559 RepID=UPI003CF4B3AD